MKTAWRSRTFCKLAAAILAAAVAVGAFSCGGLQAPTYYEVFELYGTPYERGYQHGAHFSDKIRSLYTMLLTTSIFPYLNRERPDVASVMLRYQDEKYLNGNFSYQMMLDSALNLAKTLPQDYLDELQGVADGARLPFDQILVLNTFFDTLMGFRAIVNYIQLSEGPSLKAVEFFSGAEKVGASNPYAPSPYATVVELPADARVRLVIAAAHGVDPSTVRLQLDETLYTAADPSVQTIALAADNKTVEVMFTPPGGLAAAAVHSLIVEAGDTERLTDEPPEHARYMRAERIVFSTRGYGRAAQDIENMGLRDPTTEPPAIAFAVKDGATPDGQVRLASHFAMLDSNTSHKHAVLFVHHPSHGKTFAFCGWTGVIWGVSGMNENGLAYAVDSSDTLNNPFVAQFNKGLIFAELVSSGIPMGIMGREMLIGAANVSEASAYLQTTPATFGWNFLLADAAKNIAAVELDANIENKPDGGFFTYSSDRNDPRNLDPWGRLYASLGEDDLRMASHYQKNVDDVQYQIVTFNIQPQRCWSSFYFRSLRVFYRLGQEIAARYGGLDRERMVEVLRVGDLVDHRDSMNAAIYEPQSLMIHFAMGREPATSGPFHPYNLGAAARKGGAK